MSTNPYWFACHIVGIGFKSVDLIAERLGIARTVLIRASAFLIEALALAAADRLLTRDRGLYREYFAGLKALDPSA